MVHNEARSVDLLLCRNNLGFQVTRGLVPIGASSVSVVSTA
jgi:hypothetical protein